MAREHRTSIGSSRLAAELYSLTHRGNPGDLAFYRRVCRGAASVLELGAGAGRILSALVEDGRLLVGVERDPELLALARKSLPARRVRLFLGDMCHFEIGRPFERILIPYSGFLCLLGRGDALRCLRAVRRHLAPGGRLVFDTYAADAFHADARPADRSPHELEFVVELEHRGRSWRVFEKSRWQRGRQRLDVTYVYELAGSRRKLEFALPQRYWLAQQIAPLLASAGLELESLAGGFRGERYRPRSSELLVVAAIHGRKR